MQTIVQPGQRYDAANLADELSAALGSNFGLSTAGNVLTLYTQPGDDEAAIAAVVEAHLAADPAARDLAKARAAALSAIDAKAEQVRLRYITGGSGQAATYLLKAAQATAFKEGGYLGTVPGLVQAEIAATGLTPQPATDSILAQQAAWEAKAAEIESARRRGKVAVGAATDAAGVEAARDVAITELVTL